MSSKRSAHQAQGLVTTPSNDRWVSEKEAAEILDLSVAWFQRSRWAGSPIPYTKFGRAVRYKLSDIHDFMERNKIGSTSEKAGAA